MNKTAFTELTVVSRAGYCGLGGVKRGSDGSV